MTATSEETATFRELNRINELYAKAKTLKEYEEADRAFFAVDPEVRAEWLKAEAKRLFA
jgi:uncharacterized protein YnzC (UPF0291/DUF896 family)